MVVFALAYKLTFSFYVQIFKTSQFPLFSHIFKKFQGTSILSHTFSKKFLVKKLNKLFLNRLYITISKILKCNQLEWPKIPLASSKCNGHASKW